MEMFMKAKKMKVKGADAMAIRDGFVASPVAYKDLIACNDKKYILKGSYEMEYQGEEIEDEEEMD
jgi:hypothetical protein